MGLGLAISTCACEAVSDAQPTVPNPQPDKFQIMHERIIGDCTIVEVVYAGCTNYEGRKIMLYKGVGSLLSATRLDPHFCEGPHPSPVARFVPTREGWSMAVHLACVLRDAARRSDLIRRYK